ncbi:MAG: DUF5119 domain-containing protein [Duncaniella sp.]|nr:DUF5119 domain-containing protein [Duncaniella sp.]
MELATDTRRPRKTSEMKRARILTRSILCFGMFMVCLLLGGCRHRDLCHDHPHTRVQVIVEFDWAEDPGANPSEMTVHLFRTGSRSPYVFDFKGREGGTIAIPAGTYAALCYNNDSDSHGFTGKDSHQDFGLRLGDLRSLGDMSSSPLRFPRAQGAENERMANTPDSIWVGTVQVFEVDAPEPGVTTAVPQVMRFEMFRAVYMYTFIIHNTVNFNNSTTITASISGMSGTVHPGRRETGSETVTHAFGMKPTKDGGLIGQMLTFGHCASNPIGSRRASDDIAEHLLVVNATLSDGSQWHTTHNVTDQIHGYSPTADCVVHLDSLPLPKPNPEGGGFGPTVGGWEGNTEVVGM